MLSFLLSILLSVVPLSAVPHGEQINIAPDTCAGQVANLKVVADPTNHWTVTLQGGFRIVGLVTQEFLVEGFDCKGNQIDPGRVTYSIVNGSNLLRSGGKRGSPQFGLQAWPPAPLRATLTVSVTDNVGNTISHSIGIQTSTAVYVHTPGGMATFDIFGNALPLAPTAFQGAVFGGMVYDTRYNILVATDPVHNTLTLWSLDGSLEQTISDPQLASPGGLAYDMRSGYVYVANTGGPAVFKPGVLVFDLSFADATPVGGFASLARPTAIGDDAGPDTILVTDVQTHSIDVFTSAGSPIATRVVPLSSNGSFAIDYVTHQIYVADPASNSIDVYSRLLAPKKSFGAGVLNGPAEVSFDRTEHQIFVASCCFNAPNPGALVDEFSPDGLKTNLGSNGGFLTVPAGTDLLVVAPY